MSSPGLSGETNKAADLFEDLWRQLRECHQNALQELEAKVSKLKKERCLDAQRLEVFYNRNQQLKEQNKTLQDAVGVLEDRLRAGECNRCAVLEDNLKNSQDQNLRLVSTLKKEMSVLEEENRKLHAEVQKLQMTCSELRQAGPPGQEESIIPDSPVLPSSLPGVNKLKKRKDVAKSRHVRYAELPLLQCNKSLYDELKKEPVNASKNPGRAEVLVPNTCELDISPSSKDMNLDRDEVIAETCGLEVHDQHHVKTETTTGQQSSFKTSRKNNVRLKPYISSLSSTPLHSPDSTTERSPSLLPRVKRFSEDSTVNKAKRKKEEGEREGVDAQRDGGHLQPELTKRTSKPLSSQSFVKQPVDPKVLYMNIQVQQYLDEDTVFVLSPMTVYPVTIVCRHIKSAQDRASSQRPHVSCASPAFKKPNGTVRGERDGPRKTRTHLQHLNAPNDQHEAGAERRPRVEPTWSIDPALALSMYDSEWRGDEEEKQEHGDLEDSDCTWVSHSLLHRQGGGGSISGLGQKANDSLDMMFDTTAYGEYKSYNSSHLGQSQTCDDEDEAEEEEEAKDSEQEPPANSPGPSKAQCPTFAHVAVIRKKEERRKLKGTTCKECEIYYAHLPEEDKQKKLSACSRHRFLFIPPSTPENFWEVGFPSTQTCIERGYSKEEKSPQVRSRRRQPLNALFSPKQDS